MPYKSPLKVQVASVICQGPGVVLPDVDGGSDTLPLLRFINTNNAATPCEAYQRILMTLTEPTAIQGRQIPVPDIIVYAHDDVTVLDPHWLQRILEVFSNSDNCVAVGLGGATHLGRPNLYKRPYELSNMARGGYCSNQTDCQVHGGHETQTKRVAVLDAFLMAVRVDWLKQVGGWPTKQLSHHCLDLWLACMAARWGKEVWMVGAECTHHGGGSSTKSQYAEAKWLQGGTLASDHQEPHLWLATEFSDVLPMEVK